MFPSPTLLLNFLVLRAFVAGVILVSAVVPQVRAEVIQVRFLGPNSLFTSQDSAAISTELNNILVAATGYTGSSASTTVLSGRALTESYYRPSSVHRTATRAALASAYDYLVILPETGFLSIYPEVVFEGVLQMSRAALKGGARPLLLMPGLNSSDVTIFGEQTYRIANGCGIDAVPGGYATQAAGLLGTSSALDLKRQAYLLAATLFTKITGLNAASDSSYIPTENGTPLDFVNLASVAASTLGTHSTMLHYSTSRETTGKIRYRPITPVSNTVRYAWTGTSTETGIRDALNPILTASGYAVSDRKINGSLGWSATTFEAAKPILDLHPNQYLFAYGRVGFITLPGKSLINYNQANLIPFNFDRHFDNPGTGTASITNILEDIYDRTASLALENNTYGWAAIPFHLGAARLNDLDPALIFSYDGTHVSQPLYNMMATMMVTSALGRDPTPTASILAGPQSLKGFNVGKQIIKQLAFLAETEAFVPDTKLSIVGLPSLGVTKGVTIDHTFSAINGTPPYTWSEQSSAGLPPGLTLSPNGRLSGFTSASPGDWQLVLNVKDSAGAIRKLPQTLSVSVLSYALWAATHAPVGNASGDDDGDGVANGVEYVLGGTHLTQDHSKLPKISESGNNILFVFDRSQSSIYGTSSVVVEVGSSLLTWPESYAVPNTATVNVPGISVEKDISVGFDRITLTLPKAADPVKFARLKVVPN